MKTTLSTSPLTAPDDAPPHRAQPASETPSTAAKPLHIVAMCEHRGMLFVATTDHLLVLVDGLLYRVPLSTEVHSFTCDEQHTSDGEAKPAAEPGGTEPSWMKPI